MTPSDSDWQPGDIDDIVPSIDEPDDDDLSGEAELRDGLAPEQLAGDEDYDAVDEPVAEDPKDL